MESKQSSEISVLNVFYLKSRTRQRLRLANNYKAEKYNKTIDKSEIAEIRKIEKQKSKERQKVRDIKNEKLKKVKLINDYQKIFLKKKSKKRKTREIGKFLEKKTQQEVRDCLVKNNRIIWTNLNYKDEKTDLTKFRPYLIKSMSLSGKSFFLELLTITSQDWKAKFKYEVETNPQCFKKEITSFVYLDTLIYIELKKKDLKSLCKCDCKNCFNEKEYNSIISLQKEFQKNNENKMKKIEIGKEALMAQIQIPPK